MEQVIDRKDYRRTEAERKENEEDKIEFLQKKIRKFLWQSLLSAFLLLIVSILKVYHFTEILEPIEEKLHESISISEMQKSGQRLWQEAALAYHKLDFWVTGIFQKWETDTEGKSGYLTSGESSFWKSEVGAKNSEVTNMLSGEKEKKKDENSSGDGEIMDGIFWNGSQMENSGDTYVRAVEGMNQMLEDANYIKQNYQMIVPVVGTVTSVFGVRDSTNPIVSHYHSGLDLAANTGTQILAALDGEVIEAATDTYYGKYLKIQKDDMIMVYAHCSKLLVKVGDKVKKGSLIAYVGNTGNSTGPHLHFEIRYQDRLVNPSEILEME